MRRAPLLAVLSVALAACGENATERAFFDRAKDVKQVGHFKLAEVVPGDWTTVCFHGGYTTVPELKIQNDETDWTLVFYNGVAEVARVQGSYRKLVLNSPHSPETRAQPERVCHGRDASIVWDGGRAMFRAGAR